MWHSERARQLRRSQRIDRRPDLRYPKIYIAVPGRQSSHLSARRAWEAELTELTQTLRNKFATLRERRDVIVFDQRGTGFSPGEVECSAVYEGGYDAAAERVQNEGFEGLEVAGEVQNVLMETCIEALEENDVDLTVYNTINNARDVAALADALGHDTYNLYGLSYGTKLGSESFAKNRRDCAQCSWIP